MSERRLTGHFPISPFVMRAASDHEYERVAAFLNSINRERRPDDPPHLLEELVQIWKNYPDFLEEEAWLVWDAEQTGVVGFSRAWIDHTLENEHTCEFDILVLPVYRRQGIARQLLPYVMDFARRTDRRLLKATTYGTIPAGEAFLRRLDAHIGLETVIHQFKTGEVPRNWVEKWVQAGKVLSARFELGLWEGPVPEEYRPAVAALIQMVLRDAPHDQLETEPMQMTPDNLRQIETSRCEGGIHWWTMYVRDRANGQIVGWTEVVWNLRRPMIVSQSGTGVYPDYRGQGLGHWLKAAMIQKLLRDHSEMQVIRTDNANSNAAMVKINQEMGYRPYITLTFWQAERDRLEAYLAGDQPEIAAKSPK